MERTAHPLYPKESVIGAGQRKQIYYQSDRAELQGEENLRHQQPHLIQKDTYHGNASR